MTTKVTGNDRVTHAIAWFGQNTPQGRNLPNKHPLWDGAVYLTCLALNAYNLERQQAK